MSRVGLLFALLLPSMPALAQPSVEGSWFGFGQPEDKMAMWVERFSPNGDYNVFHRSCIDIMASNERQQGRWTVSDDTLTVTGTEIQGQPRSVVYAYKIEALGENHFSYRNERNFLYTARRVAADFRMPSCRRQ
jgi:hypothetical protein